MAGSHARTKNSLSRLVNRGDVRVEVLVVGEFGSQRVGVRFSRNEGADAKERSPVDIQRRNCSAVLLRQVGGQSIGILAILEET
jgi:hypothetical protein